MFQIGQQVTVIDGGWTGTIERIDPELQAAYIRFPDRPDFPPYAFEALRPAAMFDILTDDERLVLRTKLSEWAHEFAEIGRPLSYVALANHGTEFGTALWAERDRYYDVMTELHEVMNTDLAAA